MTMMQTLKSGGRAAIVALTLAGATLGALPAQAQSGPSFNFQLGIGPGGNSFGFDLNDGAKKRMNKFPRNFCMSDSQVERGLRNYGFRNVDVVRHLSKSRVQAIGDWNRRTYVMTVNKCTGQVTNIERVRRRPGFGFGFSLDF